MFRHSGMPPLKPGQIYHSSAEAFELPRVVALGPNLYAAAFVLMKLLPARVILDRARDEGLIGPESLVVETTSGTFGLALATVSVMGGYRLIIVSDPVIDEALRRRLEDLGARVEIVDEPAPVGGYQRARLDRLAQIQKEHPGSFCPSQYDNPNNPMAYERLAEFLVEVVGEVDCLIGAVGSGGSMCGTSAFLRSYNPDLHSIGIDTHGSVLFGQPDRKRLLRGLGNSLMPKNLDHSVFDEIHWVTAAEAFHATRALHQSHGLFMGGTSGAAFLVAAWWARENPDARVVVLLPDEGYRYTDTIYNDSWLHSQGLMLSEPAPEPALVEHPHDADQAWSRMHWKRRTYEEVMGSSFEPAEAT